MGKFIRLKTAWVIFFITHSDIIIAPGASNFFNACHQHTYNLKYQKNLNYPLYIAFYYSRDRTLLREAVYGLD